MATATVVARSAADSGGDAFAGLDRRGEGGLVARLVLDGHQFQAQFIGAFGGHRQTDQPATIFGHEVNGLGTSLFGGDDEIALILPVFVIDQDEHAPITGVLNHILNGGKFRFGGHGNSLHGAFRDGFLILRREPQPIAVVGLDQGPPVPWQCERGSLD
jgi:hypothetical protein